jgi:hypothetical protein
MVDVAHSFDFAQLLPSLLERMREEVEQSLKLRQPCDAKQSKVIKALRSKLFSVKALSAR